MRTKLIALSLFSPLWLSAADLAPANVSVGQHLQAYANVQLNKPAPDGGLIITLTSSDPGRVLLSPAPESAGKASIELAVAGGSRSSPEYYVQGLGSEGTVTYTASAPGFETGTGGVKLGPSGIVFARSTVGMTDIHTTTGAHRPEIGVSTMLLDPSLNCVDFQPVAGGRSVTVEIATSSPAVGRVTLSPVTIPGGSVRAMTEFQPAGAGQTTLSARAQGFSVPAQFATLPIVVNMPGLAITDGEYLGKNLQLGGALSLGEPAPAGGVVVTLQSGDARQLLLSKTRDAEGSPSITIAIPAGGVNATYFLQAVGNPGAVTYSAVAPGYRSRQGTITLTPSGVVLGGPQGPPDEAELFNKAIAEGPHGFFTRVGEADSTVSVYTAHLHPENHRAADLTVQALRPGVSLTVELKNANPEVGELPLRLTIPSGASSAVAKFKPSRPGVTEISVVTPEGFTQARNSTALTITVRP
jgi:hypothetical protein